MLALTLPSPGLSLKGHAHYISHARTRPSHEDTLAPRGHELLPLRLLAVRSNQLSYETIEFAGVRLYTCIAMLAGFRLRQVLWDDRIPISGQASNLMSDAPAQLHVVVVSSLSMSARHGAELLWTEHTLNSPHGIKMKHAKCPSPSRCIEQPSTRGQNSSNSQPSHMQSDALPLRHAPVCRVTQAASYARRARTASRPNLLV